MRKLALGIGAAALALAPVGVANATGGSTPPSNYVYISDWADYDVSGTNIDIGLQVRCKNSVGTGTIEAFLEQAPPETPYPVGTGTGVTAVVCDGKTRPVALTVVGAVFDAGRAKATATLTVPLGKPTSTTASKSVTIRQ
jgi:hypothetical protein